MSKLKPTQFMTSLKTLLFVTSATFILTTVKLGATDPLIDFKKNMPISEKASSIDTNSSKENIWKLDSGSLARRIFLNDSLISCPVYLQYSQKIDAFYQRLETASPLEASTLYQDIHSFFGLLESNAPQYFEFFGLDRHVLLGDTYRRMFGTDVDNPSTVPPRPGSENDVLKQFDSLKLLPDSLRNSGK